MKFLELPNASRSEPVERRLSRIFRPFIRVMRYSVSRFWFVCARHKTVCLTHGSHRVCSPAGRIRGEPRVSEILDLQVRPVDPDNVRDTSWGEGFVVKNTVTAVAQCSGANT